MNLSSTKETIENLSNNDLTKVINEILSDKPFEDNTLSKKLINSLNSDEDKFLFSLSALKYLLLKEVNERFSKYI